MRVCRQAVVVVVVVGLFTSPARAGLRPLSTRAERDTTQQSTNTINGGAGGSLGGTCPEFCPFDYTPVCGNDGITYTNPCSLSLTACTDKPSLTASYMGTCDTLQPPQFTTTTSSPAIGAGGAGLDNEFIECPEEACPEVIEPVCGSDGNTYNSACEMQVLSCLVGIRITVVAQTSCDKASTTTAATPSAPAVETSTCPQECPRILFPVCGSDGKTYENMCILEVSDCESRAAGGPSVIVVSEGACEATTAAASVSIQTEAPSCSKQCTRIFLPVCGSDGKTYNNKCLLEIADCESIAVGGPSVIVVSENACETTTEATSIVVQPEASSCSKQCTRIFLPVCGSDGKTYNNKCLLEIADCESRAAGGPGVSLASEDACGRPEPTVSPKIEEVDVAVSCRRRCSSTKAPVCGSDGNTYDNECLMEEASCRSRREGGSHVYLMYGGQCDSMFDSLGDGCRQKCTEKYEPVCGSDGITYDNECVLESTNCGRWARREQGVYIVDDEACDDSDESRTLEYDSSLKIVLASSLSSSHSASHSDDLPSSSFSSSSSSSSSSSLPVCSEACTREFRPVCGSDGSTYNNPCSLEVANCKSRARGGIPVVQEFEGPCVAALPRGPVCDHRCERVYAPVCGSDGETYINECLLQHADCLNAFVSITVVRQGSCDGTLSVPPEDSEESEEAESLEIDRAAVYVLSV